MTMYSACCRFDAGLSEQKDLVRWMDALLRRMSDPRNHTAIVSAVSMAAIEPQDWWKCCLVDPDEEERVDLISAADDLMLMIATGNEFFPDAGFIKLRGVYETYKDHIMCCWPEMPSARIICRNLMDKFRLYGAVQEENRSLAFSYELLDYLADDPSDYEKDDARTGPDTEFMGT
jgi:hypothetical protein